MHFSYSLAEDDLISLAEFQIEQSGRLQKQTQSRRILYPVGFGLLSLGNLLTTENLVLPLMFGLLAVISFFSVPTIYSWLTRRRLPQIVRTKIRSTSLGERTVSVSEEGLQQRIGESYYEVPWSVVDSLTETTRHVFVAIDGSYTVVIPMKEVDEGELKRFIELLSDKIPKVDA